MFISRRVFWVECLLIVPVSVFFIPPNMTKLSVTLEQICPQLRQFTLSEDASIGTTGTGVACYMALVHVHEGVLGTKEPNANVSERCPLTALAAIESILYIFIHRKTVW